MEIWSHLSRDRDDAGSRRARRAPRQFMRLRVRLAILTAAVANVVAGDVVVQCGARHAWRNYPNEPTIAAFVMVGVGKTEAR